MYKRILVPLDGSNRAERILPQVEEIALRFKAKLILLQVVEPILYYVGRYPSMIDFNSEMSKERLVKAKKYLSGLKGEFREKGVSSKVIVEEGPVVSTIIKISNQEDVGLIAMASHGYTGLSRVFYGSIAAGVLHQVDRPLLLIRTRRD